MNYITGTIRAFITNLKPPLSENIFKATKDYLPNQLLANISSLCWAKVDTQSETTM